MRHLDYGHVRKDTFSSYSLNDYGEHLGVTHFEVGMYIDQSLIPSEEHTLLFAWFVQRLADGIILFLLSSWSHVERRNPCYSRAKSGRCQIFALTEINLPCGQAG